MKAITFFIKKKQKSKNETNTPFFGRLSPIATG